MQWPDDDRLTRAKPLGSTRDGLMLANVHSDLVKVKSQLNNTRSELDDMTNKLRSEETRCLQLESELAKRTEELHNERLSQENIRAEYELATRRAASVQKDLRHLELQFDDSANRGFQIGRATDDKVGQLEAQVAALKKENARLHARPSISSIPVPPRRPRSSSLNGHRVALEDELRICRAALAKAEAEKQHAEASSQQARDNALKLENEKAAVERRAQNERKELEGRIQDMKDEVLELQRGRRDTSAPAINDAALDRILRERDTALEQAAALKFEKTELGKKLSRKVDQLTSLQERLEEVEFSHDDSALRNELATAKADAALAKEQLSLFRETMQNFADRRESLERTRQALQDKGRDCESLDEQLRRRQSSTADLAVQVERNVILINEREDLKDALAKSNAIRSELESDLQSAQRTISTLQLQLNDCEVTLKKSRTFNEQQLELYRETVKACSAAEKHALEAERELQRLQDEIANRSTVSEAQERNRQWIEAVDRVAQLEQADKERQSTSSSSSPSATTSRPIRKSISLGAAPLQQLVTADPAEADAVAKLLIATDRLRAERNDLRHNVHFLKAEKRALALSSEEALKQQQLKQLLRLKSAEDDILDLRGELDDCEECLLDASEQLNIADARIASLETKSMALLVVIQHLDQTLQPAQSSSPADLQSRHVTPAKEPALSLGRSSVPSSACGPPSMSSAYGQTADQPLDGKQSLFFNQIEADLELMGRPRHDSGLVLGGEEDYQFGSDQERSESPSSIDPLFMEPLNIEVVKQRFEELQLRIDRRTEQIGVQQDDIRRLEMNLKIAEDAADDMRSELGSLRIERACLEEDAARVREERDHMQHRFEDLEMEADDLRSVQANHALALEQQEQQRLQEVSTMVELAFRSLSEMRQQLMVMDAIQIELDDARIASQFHEEENQRINNELQRALVRGDELAEYLQHSEEMIDDAVAERTEALEEQVELYSVEVESLEVRLAEVQIDLKAALSQKVDLESQVAELARESTPDESFALEQLEKQVEDLKAAADESRQHFEASQALLVKGVQEAKAALAAALEQHSVSIATLEEQIKHLSEEKDKLTVQLEAKGTSEEALRAEIVGLAAQVEEVEILQDEVAQAHTLIDEEQAKYQGLASLHERLEGDLGHCRGELSQAVEARATLEKRLSAISQRARELPKLQAQMEQMTRQITSLEASLHEAQQAASAAASTTVRDAEASVKILQLETLIQTLKEENQDLEQVLTLKTEEIDKYEDRLIEVRKERKKLETKVDSLNRKLRNMQKQMDAVSGVSSPSEMPDSRPSSTIPFAKERTDSSSLRPSPSTRSQSDNNASMVPLAPRPSVQTRTIFSDAALQHTQSSGSERSSTTNMSTQPPAPIIFSPPIAGAPTPSLRRATSSLSSVGQPSLSSTGFKPTRSAPPAIAQPPVPNVMISSPTQPAAASAVQEERHLTPLTSATPSQSRKRRLPDDFDPPHDEIARAVPVMAGTPTAGLRRMIKEGSASRTAFTPSRSRKGSAATSERSVAQAAAATVANAQLLELPTSTPPVSSLPEVLVRPKTPNDRTTLRKEVVLSREASKPTISHGKNVEEQNQNRPTFDGFSATTKAATTTSSAAPTRVRGGWLNRTANRTASGTADSKTSSASISAARRALSNLNGATTLGAAPVPFGPDGQLRKSLTAKLRR